jgi:hypothetical protein
VDSFGNFMHNLKTFRLTRLANIDSDVKSWELNMCTLAHSSLWDRNSTFIQGNHRTIEGQTLSMNPNFILDINNS